MKRFACTRLTLTILALLTLVATIVIPGAARTASAAPVGSVTEYPLPSANSNPTGITNGPDGALWFAEGLNNRIGRISTSGQVTEYPLELGDTGSSAITTGPDGALWFLDGGPLGCSVSNLCAQIGRLTTSGQVTDYPIPTPNSQPEDIAVGPDGALWFTETTADKIGRITTAGAITEYSLPSGNHGAWGITAGPDGALWFTDYFGDAIGRLTTSGQVTEYPVLTPNSNPLHITTGPDGALWFTESTNLNVGNIGRITTAGAITEYSLPVDNVPGGITVGPDSALWFTVQAPTASQTAFMGRITTAGTITEYPVPTPNSNPDGISLGPDGALWFTENQANQIGRITASSPPPPPPSYQLSLTPGSQTATIGGQGLVTATVRDAATGAPAASVTLSFRVEAGPNAGLSGTCFPSNCTADNNGQVGWGYFGTAAGTDTVQVWLDSNGNGTPDAGEPQATAEVAWDGPVQVAGNSSNEPSVAVDPRDPNHVVVGYNQYIPATKNTPESSRCLWSETTDGGATWKDWKQGHLPGMAQSNYGSDPTVRFASDGTLYYSCVVIGAWSTGLQAESRDVDILLYESSSGQASQFSANAAVVDQIPQTCQIKHFPGPCTINHADMFDHPSLVLAHQPGSPSGTATRAVLCWTRSSGTAPHEIDHVFTSWVDPDGSVGDKQLLGDGLYCFMSGPPTMTSASWLDSSGSFVAVKTSFDGGASWSQVLTFPTPGLLPRNNVDATIMAAPYALTVSDGAGGLQVIVSDRANNQAQVYVTNSAAGYAPTSVLSANGSASFLPGVGNCQNLVGAYERTAAGYGYTVWVRDQSGHYAPVFQTSKDMGGGYTTDDGYQRIGDYTDAGCVGTTAWVAWTDSHNGQLTIRAVRIETAP